MVFVSFLKMCTILVINMNEGHLRMFLLQVDIDPDCHRLLVKNAIDIESMKLRGEKVALIIPSFAEVISFSCFFPSYNFFLQKFFLLPAAARSCFAIPTIQALFCATGLSILHYPIETHGILCNIDLCNFYLCNIYFCHYCIIPSTHMELVSFGAQHISTLANITSENAPVSINSKSTPLQ